MFDDATRIFQEKFFLRSNEKMFLGFNIFYISSDDGETSFGHALMFFISLFRFVHLSFKLVLNHLDMLSVWRLFNFYASSKIKVLFHLITRIIVSNWNSLQVLLLQKSGLRRRNEKLALNNYSTRILNNQWAFSLKLEKFSKVLILDTVCY